jgi:hypothetical protein
MLEPYSIAERGQSRARHREMSRNREDGLGKVFLQPRVLSSGYSSMWDPAPVSTARV